MCASGDHVIRTDFTNCRLVVATHEGEYIRASHPGLGKPSRTSRAREDSNATDSPLNVALSNQVFLPLNVVLSNRATGDHASLVLASQRVDPRSQEDPDPDPAPSRSGIVS